MIKSVQQGIENYERMLRQYLERKRDMKREFYGEETPEELWEPADLRLLNREYGALQTAISILGITQEEESRLYLKAYQAVMGTKTTIRFSPETRQTVNGIPCATKKKEDQSNQSAVQAN